MAVRAPSPSICTSSTASFPPPRRARAKFPLLSSFCVRFGRQLRDCPGFVPSQTRQTRLCSTSFQRGSSATHDNKWGSPMNDKPQNLQDTFLNAVRKSKTAVTIYLVNGVKLQGNITWFDNFCVLLRRDGQVQLVYKHAISTVMPMGPVQLQDQEVSVAEVA